MEDLPHLYHLHHTVVPLQRTYLTPQASQVYLFCDKDQALLTNPLQLVRDLARVGDRQLSVL
jgi:hypothetical protein